VGRAHIPRTESEDKLGVVSSGTHRSTNLRKEFSNYDNQPDVALQSFQRMMFELKVTSYTTDLNSARRLDDELAVPGKFSRIDYLLLQSCLATYLPEDKSLDTHQLIMDQLLKKCENKEDLVVSYLDIIADGKITISEFSQAVKREFKDKLRSVGFAFTV
jgi:hypothetical protein